MIDYQRIADEIREFLEGADQTLDPHVAELAQSYADACKGANARLRRCGDLLRRGLRSEAIGVAQESSDLLDVVAALDLPMLAEWENFCAMHTLPRPPRLLMDVAAELNDAYAVVEPLEASLDELRLLALARAPAFDRLHVVRRLRTLDPDTPHWTDDARELERACLAGVRQDVARVVASGDAVAAHRLAEAITSPDWITAPPRDLVEPLARLELQGLAQDMEHARGVGDAARASRAVEALRRTSAKRKLPLTPEYAAAVGGTERWLAEQSRLAEEKDHFHEICAQLEASIVADAPLSILEMLHAQARAYQMPIPARVAELYAAADREKRTVAERAKRRNLVLVAVGLLAVAAGTFYAMSQARTAAAVKGWVGRIDQAIAQYEFDAGRQAWDELQARSPEVAGRPDVAAARRRFTAAEQAESKRTSQLADVIASAESDDVSSDVRMLRLLRAEPLARLDSERLKIRTLRRQIESRRDAPTTTPSSRRPRPSLVPLASGSCQVGNVAAVGPSGDELSGRDGSREVAGNC